MYAVLTRKREDGVFINFRLFLLPPKKSHARVDDVVAVAKQMPFHRGRH